MIRFGLAMAIVAMPTGAFSMETATCQFDTHCQSGAACVAVPQTVTMRRAGPIDGVVEVSLGDEVLAAEFLDARFGAALLGGETAVGGLFIQILSNGAQARLFQLDLRDGHAHVWHGQCGRFE